MKKYFILGFILLSFFVVVKPANAASLIGSSNTISTSRPSPSSPLSVDLGAGDTQAAIINNGSRFLASDSAKVIRTSTNGLIDTATVVASQSAALTSVFFGETAGNAAQSGTDVLFVPITAMHNIQFTTVTEIPDSGDILITFPSLVAGDANNEASPSASTFQFNNLDANAAGNIQIVDDGANITGSATFAVTNPSAGVGGTVLVTLSGTTIAAGSVVNIFIGCTAVSGSSCSAQAPAIINPTKTATAGTADIWKNSIMTRDGSDNLLDQATVAIATIDAVQIMATIDPTLTFTIAGVGNGAAVNTGNTTGCLQTETTNSGISSTSTVVNLGIVVDTPSAINTKVSNISAQLLTVSTNAAGGYALTATSAGSLQDYSSGFAIASNTTPQAFPNSTNFFGMHACGLDTYTGGIGTTFWNTTASNTACNTYITGSAGNICNYGWPNSVTPITLASDATGPVGNVISAGNGITSVSYAAGADVTVPAGFYQTYITYVATPTF